MEYKDLLISCSQYHVYWWPDDARTQALSSHGIGFVILEYSGRRDHQKG